METLAVTIPWRHCFRIALFVAALNAAARQAHALEVDQVLWGFDGQAVAERFNTLAVLFRNPTPKGFDGVIRLRRSIGGQPSVGDTVEEPIFVGPFSSKWIQFAPFAKADYEEWRVSWGKGGDERFVLPQVRLGKPARVLLANEDSVLEKGGALKHFPAHLFPPMVTATDGLHTAVLGHVPRWEENRRQAFLDWLTQGGRLILLPDVDGRHLNFPPGLAELNSPLDEFHVGSGSVERHALTPNQLDRVWVEKVVYGGVPPDPNPAPPSPRGMQAQGPLTMEFLDDGFFRILKAMTRPNHNWVLINLMSLVYILLIFPGLYWLGKWRADYRLVYGALLGCVSLFSYGFATVGRRGYGEATATHAVAIARPIPEGGYDVNQWSNVFVTDGDDYTITYSGTGRIFSTCQNVEEVNGIVRNGAEGFFLVDIPPFSSRTYAHRVKLANAGRPTFKVASTDLGENLEELAISVEGAFPPGPARIVALHRDRFYDLEFAEGTLKRKSAGQPRAEYLSPARFNDFQQQGMMGWNQNVEKTEDQHFADLFLPLLARAVDLDDPGTVAEQDSDSKRIRIYIYAPMPEGFLIQNPRLGKQRGFVLYRNDVFLPEKP